MFHRRRAASNPPTNSQASAAATTAATQAFLAHRASNASLSNAAAAAALRTHATSPVPVSTVQTKRIIRKQASNSSLGSGGGSVRGSGGRGLQRQNSAGSMTERTFRDPSPSRGGSTIQNDNPPPVPALPKNIVPPVPQKSSRRASSLEPPLRVSSPPPKKPHGRGLSLDRGPGSPPLTNPRQRLPQLNSVQELQRTDSSGSINFSYPTNARNTSPTSPSEPPRVASPTSAARRPGSPLATGPRPNNTLNNGEVSSIQNFVQDAANRPVKKKKKVAAKGAVEGGHLAGGSLSGRPTGSPINGDAPQRTQARSPPPTQLSTDRIASPEPSTAVSKPKMKKKVKAVSSPSPDQAAPADSALLHGSDIDSGAESASSATDRPKGFNTRAAGMLAKQPSIVREDRDLEEAAESGGRAGALPQLQTGVVQGRKVASANSSKKYSEYKQHSRSTSQPTPTTTPTTSTPSGAISSGANLGAGPGKSSLRGERHQSLSPSRSTRFSSKPTVFDSLNAARHEPPPRSISPAKSALKQSPSPRQRSPIDPQAVGIGRGYGKTPSEASDNTSLLSEEGALSGSKKKKQARVSFDEEAVIVGNAVSPPTSPDTPVVMSPQNETTKRSWFSLGKKGKAEQDDIMKPTPALPAFGSVRRDEGISNRQQGNELPESIPAPHSSLARAVVDRINMSSDSAIGSILSQDLASKQSVGQQEAGEPGRSTLSPSQSDDLPPQAASVEGAGYCSETDGSVYSTDDYKYKGIRQGPSFGNSEDQVETYRALASPPLDDDDEVHQLGAPQQIEDVPSFNIIQATPNLQETEDREQWPGLSSTVDRSADDEAYQVFSETPVVEHHLTDPTPASLGISEPAPEEAVANHSAGSPAVGEMAEGLRLQTEPHDEDESDDTGNSIYSDAAEDLSDIEGDGFGSINAIVESPVVKPSLAVTTPSDSPASKVPEVGTRPKNQLARQESDIPEPSAEEGWDKAQEYWSNLSDRRKKQIELEAMSAEDEAVVEPVQLKPKKKVVKKKTTQPVTTTQPNISDDPPLPPWPDQQYLSSAARSKKIANAGLKSSMRTEPTAKPSNLGGLQQSKWAGPKSSPGESGMKKSTRNDGNMRPGGRGQTAGSARQAGDMTELQPTPRPRPPRDALQKKARPNSAAPVVDYSKIPTSATKHTRDFSGSSVASSTAPAAPRTTKKKTVNPTPLKKALSNGSDSSSSFRKQRRPASGGFTMRSTMRGGPDPMQARDVRPSSPENVGTKSSRFSIRSLSPTGTGARKPFNSPAGGGMRSSMRGSMDTPAPSLRKDPRDRAKSPSRFSFGGKQKAKAAPTPKSGGFRSRFADSSDEDDYPATFKSRYDSSDDDEPASPAPLNLAPVRGIPRRIGEADKESTDLSDSEEEPASPAHKPSSKAAALIGSRSPIVSNPPTTVTHEGSALATGSLRREDLNMAGGLKAKKAAEKELEKKEKKRSFFGGRGKKHTEPKIAEPLQSASPPARPRQASTNGPGAASPPSRGKLQRRNTPKSVALAQNEAWPLPPPLPGVNGGRPSTADGAPITSLNFRTSLRPDIGTRRSTLPAPPVEEKAGGKAATAPVVAGETGKKKRFGGLRKVFGIK